MHMIRCKMGDIVTLEQGLAINKKSKHLVVESGMPLLRITDMLNQTFNQFIDVDMVPEKFIAKDDDLIYSRTGQVGYVFRKQEGVIHNNCFRIIPNNTIDRGYLYWYLKQEKVRLHVNTLASGAAQPDLNHDAFKSLDFSYPDNTEEQRKIAYILDQYDLVIENNNRRIVILEEMAQSLYREWFVKFRFPGHDQAAGDPVDSTTDGPETPSTIGNASQCRMVDSPLGPIPEGWELTSLGNLVNFKRNSVKKGQLKEPTPYMGLEHFPRKSFALSEWDLTTEIGSSKLAFEKGDVLFGKIRPYFHKVGIAQTDGLCSSDTFVLSSRKTEHSNLVAMVAFSESFVAHAVQTSQGTKMPRANWDVLSEYPVTLPPNDLLETFNGLAGPAIEQVRVLSSMNRNLKIQRDLLLPKLISGQIDLSQTEQGAA